jgi:o-succinylbenzoate synthase
MKVQIKKHTLDFRFAAGTSRGVLRHKDSWFLTVQKGPLTGIGECSIIRGLSPDDRPDLEEELGRICRSLSGLPLPATEEEALSLAAEQVPEAFPAARFAVEVALLDVLHGGKRQLFDTAFSRGESGIPINGLIWMGDLEAMMVQLVDKADAGFSCLKMKVGSLDFEKECDVLQYIRSKYYKENLTLRVDANGAFKPAEAMQKLEVLSKFGLHSIEQPIAPGQWALMRELCEKSPVPVALDEELIGVHARSERERLLDTLRPPFIILKPSLLGGIAATREWIALAEERGIGWWITSALEANIGLNAICQLTATYPVSIPQGLGTGQLYHNNIPSPLTIEKGVIYHRKESPWDVSQVVAGF